MSTTDYPPNDRIGQEVVRIRRSVNDDIARLGATFEAAITSGFEFVCECGDIGCDAIVRMTLAEYADTTPGSVIGH